MASKPMNKNLLSIVIPTYNRGEIIEENISNIISFIVEKNICIYISDDSPNNSTYLLISKYIYLFPELIFYHQNTPSLGHDENCITSLSLPTSDYIWYLGDSNVISVNILKQIISNIIDIKPDLIFLRRENENLPKKNELYTDNKFVLITYGWHLSLTGSTIYSRNKLKLSTSALEYINFPQAKLTFDILSGVGRFLYLGNVTIRPHPNKSISYWKSDPFSVFGKDWRYLIRSLTCLSESDRKIVVKSHSQRTGLFGIKNMLRLRGMEKFGLSLLFSSFSLIKSVSHLNLLVLLLIAILPIWIARVIVNE